MPLHISTLFNYDLDNEFLSFDKDHFHRRFHGTLPIPDSDDSYDILVRTGEQTKEGDYFIFCMKRSETLEKRSLVLDYNEKSSRLIEFLTPQNEGEKIVSESIEVSDVPFIFEMIQRGNLTTKTIIDKLSRRVKKEAQKAALEKAAHLLSTLKQARFDLQEEMRLSDLSENEVTLITDRSKGIYTIDRFFKEAAAQARGSVALGIRKHHIVNTLSDVCHLVDYMSKILDLYGDCFEHDDFVKKISMEGKGIVFFVPRHIFTHPNSGATAREMRWLLENPEALSETRFVFGAYDLISQEDYTAHIKTLPPHVPSRMKLLYKLEVLETLFAKYINYPSLALA